MLRYPLRGRYHVVHVFRQPQTARAVRGNTLALSIAVHEHFAALENAPQLALVQLAQWVRRAARHVRYGVGVPVLRTHVSARLGYGLAPLAHALWTHSHYGMFLS